MPFLKCSVLRLKNFNYTTAEGWEEVITGTGYYPIEFIEKNLNQTRETFNKELRLPVKTKEFIYNVQNYMPQIIRVPFISFLRKVFSTVSQK